MSNDSDDIAVLHVDDDPSLAETIAEFLERESERLSVTTETSVRDGLERLADEEVDCIVSEYEMPEIDGIEFLERVREEHPDLPFILFTGKGSEEIASEAISAGVTDYLQKGSGTDQYAILANRIENVGAQSRSERARRASERRYRHLVEQSLNPIFVYQHGEIVYANDAMADLLGASSPEELYGMDVAEFIHPDDVPIMRERVRKVKEDGQQVGWREGRMIGLDGETRHIETTGGPITYQGEPAIQVVLRDITARKRYEYDLEETTRTVEAIIEAAPDAITVIDGDKRVERWNPAAERMFGWAEDDVLGERLPLLPDDGADEFESRLERALEGETISGFEARRWTKDGDRIAVSVSNAPIRDGAEGITGVVSVIEDITVRKQQEAELRRLKERFEAIFEASNDAMLIVDPDAETVLEANPQAADLLGYSREELLSTVNPVRDLHPEDRERFEAFADRVLREGTGETDALTCQHKDGRLIPVEVSAATVDFDGRCCLLVNVRDITDRKRREEALNDLHETTREFMETAEQDAIATIATRTAKTILNLRRNGIWLYDEDGDALRPAAVTEEADEMVDEQPIFSGEGSLAWEAFETGEMLLYDDVTTASGRYNPDTPIRSELIIPLADHGVMMAGSTEIGAFDDIDVSLAKVLAANTERAFERAEREATLRAQRRELQRQNERLEEFASVVSHDLRNPLNVAEGHIELAADERESEHLDRVRSALDRMDEMITDLLTVTREGETVEETEPVELGSIADGCWGNIDAGAAELTVETELTVEADRSRFRHVFENLFRNAVEHAGPDVTVRVGSLEGESGFYVEDDGPGIPEEDRDHVFEPGFSTGETGTGFGLNIVKGIVEAHEWTITVTAGTDGGARFEIADVDLID